MYNPNSQPYTSGDTVRATLPGTDYQINVLILYAFKEHESGKPFELRTEDESYGKFDDIHLFHEDYFEVFQIKHFTNNFLALNNLAANARKNNKPSKEKLDLWMYFDSWFDHKDEPNFNYILYTNMAVSTEHRFNECIKEGKFISQIYRYTEEVRNAENKLSTNIRAEKTSQKSTPGENYIYDAAVLYYRIRKNSQKLKQFTNNPVLQNKYISDFLQAITFKHSQGNVTELISAIKELFRKKYNTTNDAIYLYTYNMFKEWLKEPRPMSHSHETIKNLFTEAKTKFLILERTVGLTHWRLNNIKQNCLKNSIVRNRELILIKQFIDSPQCNLLVMHGHSGAGKTTVIQQFIEQPSCNALYKDGEYIFISFEELSSDSIAVAKLLSVKLIILDNAEQVFANKNNNVYLKELLECLRHNNKKVILITKTQGFQFLYRDILLSEFSINKNSITEFSISSLTPEEIISIYPEYNKFCEIKHFYNVMSIPFYLRLIADKATALSLQSVNTLSNYELKNYIVALAIKGSHHSGKKRKLMIEKIVHVQNKVCIEKLGLNIGNIAVSLENTNSEDKEIINSLISDNVLIDKGEGVYFQHDIYREWAICEHVERSFKILRIQNDLNSFCVAIHGISSNAILDWLEYRFEDIYSTVQSLLKSMNEQSLEKINSLVIDLTIAAVYLDKADEFTHLTSLPGYTNLDKRTNLLRAKQFHQYTYLLLAITVSSKRIINNLLTRGAAAIYCSEKEGASLWWMNKQMFFGSSNNYIERNDYYYLHRAVEIGNKEVVALLLKFDQKNINMRNQYGETALHITTQLNLPDIAEILLVAGADPTIRNPTTGSPLVVFLFNRFVEADGRLNTSIDYEKWLAEIYKEPLCIIFEKYLYKKGINRDHIREELVSLIEKIREENDEDIDNIENESSQPHCSP